MLNCDVCGAFHSAHEMTFLEDGIKVCPECEDSPDIYEVEDVILDDLEEIEDV